MADDRNRLPIVKEPLHELHGFRIHTQPVGIHDTTRQQQRVVFISLRLVERAIDAHLIAPLLVLPAADRSRFQRHHIDFCSGILERLARLQELVLLEAVSRQRGDALSFQLISHDYLRVKCGASSSGVPWTGERGNIRAMPGIGDYEFQPPDGPRPSSGGGGPTNPPGPPRASGASRGALIGGVVVVIVVAVAAYLFFVRRTAPSESQAPAGTATTQAPRPAWDDFERIELPPLDDSDALVRQRIGILSSNRLVAAWLGTKGLIRNFVVVVENISHGMNPSRHLQVLKPAGRFRVMTRGSQVVVDPRNYDRFTSITDAAMSIDARSAGRLYQSFKPLLQTAYD